MKTEIEMLKERVSFLESKLLEICGRMDEDSPIYCGDVWTEMYEKFESYNEDYKKHVARIGCRECMEK